MLDEILENLPNIRPLTPKKGERWSWWRLALLIALLVGISVAIVFLLRFVEGFLKRPLEGFALYAYAIVFGVTLLSSATIILPAPGVVVVIAAASRWNPAWVAVAASLGSTLGEITAYYAGVWGSKAVLRRSRESGYLSKARRWMGRYGLFAVTFVSFVPFMAFDLVGILVGALRIPLWKFLLAVYAGRLPRAFIEAYTGGGLLNFFLNR
mgnify:CR=1 FL=1